MNINEVLYLPAKREGLNIGPDEFYCKRRYRTLDAEEAASSFKAKTKEELLDRQKPEIPQFVADWIEEHKQMYGKWDEEDKSDFVFRAINDLFRFGADLSTYDFDVDDEFSEWTTKNAYKFITAILFGYTVKKEKLYTVEIPNPNREGRGHAKFVLERQGNKVFLVKRKSKDYYYNKNSNHLTEPEIRKNFDWAWQFAKEVTE
ncbi:hypothetical protein Javan155_0032 [Streptococcus phage Javan155]|nr:hypothetical protein Javan155_0032 [Streptococcus phage Javan155]QBX23655.1 hypothetical protein Javan144_0032 [Streptococcus phage Javan144]